MNHLSKALLIGGIAVFAIPGSDALAEGTAGSAGVQIASEEIGTAEKQDAALLPDKPEKSAERSEAAVESASDSAAPATEYAGQEGAPLNSTDPKSTPSAAADAVKSPEPAPQGDSVTSGESAESSGGDAVGGEIERNFSAAAENSADQHRADDPDEAKHRAIMGEEIDQEIDRATDQAVTEAMQVSGDNDDPEAQRAVDQAITEAVDEAMAQASARSGMDSPYHTPGTHGNEISHLRNLRATSSVSGGTGLLRTESAVLGMSGVARLSLLGEFTSQGGFPAGGTDTTHAAGRLAGSLVFLRHFEGFFSYRIASDYADIGDDSELNQTLGDFRFGLKGSSQVFDGFYLGGAMHFGLMPGFGSEWDGGTGFEFSPEIIVSWDARSINRGVPVVLHLNLGGAFSNQDKIYNDYSPTAFEQFALDINRYSRLLIALGIEIPLPYVTPYAEWNMALPITSATLHDFDGESVSAGQAMSNRFTFGGKLTVLPDVTFSAGLEFGLNVKTAQGVASTPSFMFHFGLSYAFDPLLNHRRDRSAFVDLPPVALPDPHEDSQPKTEDVSEVASETSEKKNAEGVPPAPSESSPQKTPEAAEISAEPEQQEQDEKDVPRAKLFLKAKGAAVSGRVYVLEDSSKSFDVSPEGTEIPLDAGTWKVAVAADGYLAQAADLNVPQVQEDQSQNPSEIELTADAKPRPEKPSVAVGSGELKLEGKIAFMGKSSKFRSDAENFIDQIADLMLTGKAERISIECHTDFPRNANPNALMELSVARAEAVKKALMDRGISGDLLEARGFGGTKPIKPNGLPKGREMNRRVEFKILP